MKTIELYTNRELLQQVWKNIRNPFQKYGLRIGLAAAAILLVWGFVSLMSWITSLLNYVVWGITPIQ